ncbi:MAG TPA: PGF-pre-PGF domain-containing protein, partial [Candidatus Nanoarchaeia archaeon]|nr:PGF-pre-PGF domain-containing protein [Candidatus Nanoarchaeia archaeon]
VSFMFYYKKNSSVMRNITIQNFTTNQTQWNTTLDTTSFPEGIYNITVMVWNYSVEAGVTNVLINDSIWANVTFDNTKPMLNFTPQINAGNGTITQGGQNFTNSSPMITIMLFADDRRPGSGANLSLNDLVVFISNGSKNHGFNRTAVNDSGNWTIRINVSQLTPGLTTVFAYVNDTAGNRNTTKQWNFTVNSPLNVTIFNNQSINISTKTASQRLIINLSVINTSMTAAIDSGMPNSRVNITLNFDNATGTDFNITMNVSGNDPLNITRYVTNRHTFFVTEINASQLTEGLHTVTILTNDSRDNVNKSQILTFRVDNTVPTVSVSCTSNPTEGSIVTCTCTVSDSGSGVKTSGFTGGILLTESTTATGAGKSTTSSVCFAIDHTGQRTEATGSWITASASSGGGGGGGASGGSSSGGSGGAAGGATYEKKVWTSINAGETAAVVSRDDTFAVESVEFKVAETVYGAWVKVEPVTKTELPAAASAQLTGKVHDTIQITANKVSLKPEIIQDTTIKFKVAKTWLTENSVDKSDVVLMRFDDVAKKWTELVTTVGEDDGTNVKYSAQTPGFSFFAIAEKGAASGAAVAEPTGTTATGASTTDTQPTGTGTTAGSDVMVKETGGGSALWWVVAVVVVVAAVVYFVRRRKA